MILGNGRIDAVKKNFARRLFSFLLSFSFFLFGVFCGKGQILARTCQNNDDVCPENCTSGNDTDCIDMTQYWNFEPGNYWEFSDPDDFYSVRIDIEAKQTLCEGTPNEIVAVPFRVTQTPGVPASWSGGDDFRWYVSKDFDQKPGWPTNLRWARATIFSPRSAEPNPFADLEHFDPNSRIILFLSPDEDSFPPYFTTPRYLDIDDQINHPGFHELGFEYAAYPQRSEFDCDRSYEIPEDGWKVAYKMVNVETPTYMGSALRIRFWEYVIPDGYDVDDDPGDALLDATSINFDEWYLANNIGIVKINNKIKRGQRCGDDPDCRDETETMQDPMVTMNLVNYYHVGEPFNVSVSPVVVQPGGIYTVSLGETYNGYVEVMGEHESLNGRVTSIERHRWGSSAGEQMIGDFWFDNGDFSIALPGDATPGTYRFQLRPFIIGEDNGLAPSNLLPWSNEIAVIVAACQDDDDLCPEGCTLENDNDCIIEGDLNNDGLVNSADIKILLSRYGTDDSEADLNSDSIVNGMDFGEMVRLIQ